MDFQNVVEEEKRQILKELGDNPTDVDIKYVSYIRKIPVKQIEQWYEEIKSVDLSIDLQLNECYIIGNKKPKGMKSIKIKTEINNVKQLNNQETKIQEKNDNKINQENVKIPFQISQPIDVITDNQNQDIQVQNGINNEIQQNDNLVSINENNNEVNQQLNEINQQQQNGKCQIQINDKLNNNNLTIQNQNTNESIENQNQVEQLELQQNNKYISQQKHHNNNELNDSLKEASSLGLQSIIQNNQQQNKSRDNINQSLDQNDKVPSKKQIIQQCSKKKNKVQQKQTLKNLNILPSYSDSGLKDQSENQSSVKSQQIQKNIDNLSIQEQNDNKSIGIELQPISISNSPSQNNKQKQQNKNQQQNQNTQQIKQQQQIDLTNEEKPQQVFSSAPQYQNFQQFKNVPLSFFNQNIPQLAVYSNYQEQYKSYQQIMSDYSQLNSINQQFMIMNNFLTQQAQIQNVLLQKLEQVITLIKDQTKKQ